VAIMTEVILALAEHWSEIIPLLGDAQRTAVAGPAQRLLSAGDAAVRQDAALDIVEIVAPLLPAGHPVRRALAADSHRLAGSAVDWNPPVDLLRARLAAGPSLLAATRPDSAADPGEAGPAGGRAAGEGDADREAEDWLLAAPAADLAEIRQHGLDPADPGLIRIGRPAGDARWPRFQFDPSGQPRAVVTQINLLLDADRDPWGVADWWLGPNAWLDATPADLLGQADDGRLVDAARAALREA
jgi:hypothetical protein